MFGFLCKSLYPKAPAATLQVGERLALCVNVQYGPSGGYMINVIQDSGKADALFVNPYMEPTSTTAGLRFGAGTWIVYRKAAPGEFKYTDDVMIRTAGEAPESELRRFQDVWERQKGCSLSPF